MLTDVQIINQGLSKLGSSRIKRIDPAQTPLESYMAANYPQWKRSELGKRRWVFAMVDNYLLTATSTTEYGDRKYKYPLPIDCIRPIRKRHTEWVQRGRFIISAYQNLRIDYIANVPESEFDPMFNDVLSARVSYESAEYVTQSNSKEQAAYEKYREAIREAGQANAFIVGSEEIDEEENEPTWLEAHIYG